MEEWRQVSIWKKRPGTKHSTEIQSGIIAIIITNLDVRQRKSPSDQCMAGFPFKLLQLTRFLR